MPAPRPSVVALVAGKEARDLMRDRRTVLLLFVAPLVLYPLFGVTAWTFATELVGKPAVIGVVNAADAAPVPGPLPFPPLLEGDGFSPSLLPTKVELPPRLVPLDGDPDAALRDKLVQAVLVVPPGFAADLEAGRRPTLTLLCRDGDDKGKVALARLTEVVKAWEAKAKQVRFQRDGRPADYDKLVVIDDPRAAKPADKKAADELRDSFARAFPMILVMWLVAGAIQPAVDLTAGEKERGTMETLLISPAGRGEIVVGKFLAVTGFGFASVCWNVVCLTVAASAAQVWLRYPIINLPGMLGCVVLGLPIAMLFSAVSLALGVFARSTKEGQYYLVPLMLIVMPLAFWSLLPTTELTPVTAVLPVAGGMLFQQKLLAVTGEPIPWGYAVPVLGAQAIYVSAALLAAWAQFRREGVLFRETGPAKSGRSWFSRRR